LLKLQLFASKRAISFLSRFYRYSNLLASDNLFKIIPNKEICA